MNQAQRPILVIQAKYVFLPQNFYGVELQTNSHDDGKKYIYYYIWPYIVCTFIFWFQKYGDSNQMESIKTAEIPSLLSQYEWTLYILIKDESSRWMNNINECYLYLLLQIYDQHIVKPK